jgi:hypothetical protein
MQLETLRRFFVGRFQQESDDSDEDYVADGRSSNEDDEDEEDEEDDGDGDDDGAAAAASDSHGFPRQALRMFLASLNQNAHLVVADEESDESD